jgi:hypothetical protein
MGTVFNPFTGTLDKITGKNEHILEIEGDTSTPVVKLKNGTTEVLNIKLGSYSAVLDVVSEEPTNLATNGGFETDLEGWDYTSRASSFILTDTAPNDWRSPRNDNLWQGVNGINNPCPSGFRLPTSAEWQSLVSAEGITNGASAFASSLKLPYSGYRNRSNGSFAGQGSGGTIGLVA